MAFGVPDELLATFVPILVYWSYSGMYMMLGSTLDNYRLHSKKDEDEKNLVSKADCIKNVLFQQAVQALMVFLVYREDNNTPSKENTLPVIVVQYFVAMVLIDTWLYFVHRFVYHNKYLYQYIHSQHHRLVVPYAIGASYSSPIEGVLFDTCGNTLALLITGMSSRTSIFLFAFIQIKNIDDHCGFMLPWSPINKLFTNNTAYHNIHHQLYGTKYNFAQPFFVIWDKILGTHMPYTLVKKESGGFETKLLKDRKGK